MMRTTTLKSLAILLLGLAASTPQAGAQDAKPPRTVSIGGAITEIIFALGAESQLVARDSTSTYPQAATRIPDAGYMRALSAEGVLSTNPDLIIAIDGSGPPEQLAMLKSSGIRVEMVPEGYDAAGVTAKIMTVGHILGRDAEALKLAAQVEADLRAATAASARPEGERKRVLFVLSLQDGKIMAAGRGTSAQAIITLAGGVNAASEITGFKALTPEALVAARPDVILMMARGNHSAAPAEVFANPALALTPAAATQSLVVMDGLHILGFGPRTASAIRELSREIYGPKT